MDCDERGRTNARIERTDRTKIGNEQGLRERGRGTGARGPTGQRLDTDGWLWEQERGRGTGRHGRRVAGTVAGAGGWGNGYADTKISEPAFTSDSCVCACVCGCVSALWPSGAAVCLLVFRFCYFFVIFVLATTLMFTMRLHDRLSNFGFSLE